MLLAIPSSATIVSVSYSSVGPNLVDFEDVAGAPFPGVVYNGILTSGTVQFGKYFAGQTVGSLGNNDTLTSTATNPLTLQVGGANNNLSVGTDDGTNNLIGCGALLCQDADGYGEGSIAMMFPHQISQFGIQMLFADGGTTTVQFFRQDGSFIGSLTVDNSLGTDFGFSDTAGSEIAGISIWTADPGGLAYDNLLFDGGNNPTPEPSSVLLLGSGILGLAGVLRRKLKT